MQGGTESIRDLSEIDAVSQISTHGINSDMFNTAHPATMKEPMKENFNFYMTENVAARDLKNHLSSLIPPLSFLNNDAVSDNYTFSSMIHEDSDSRSSGNEIDIGAANGHSKITNHSENESQQGTLRY